MNHNMYDCDSSTVDSIGILLEFQSEKKMTSELNGLMSFLFSDDCVYIFYICTDRVGKWPKNQEICSRLFEDCETKINYLQSEVAIVDNSRIYSVTFFFSFKYSWSLLLSKTNC